MKQTHTKTLLAALTAAAGLGICATTAHGATIFDDPSNELADPAITDYATPYNNTTYAVTNIFDNNANSTYGSNVPFDNAFINFDFGVATEIGGFMFMQRGNPGVVSDFHLIFSNNADFSAPVEILEFDGAGTDFLLSAALTKDRQEFAFASAVNARYVRWDVNGANNNYAGASEMEFWAVPEPSSLALLGLGGLLMARRRRG